jgi:prophage DNA circulation protein
MSWRDNLRDASFRGQPFFVEESTLTGGRRLKVNEYPKRDEPFAEDLGRKARTFTIEAYVLGPDYMTARAALLNALEAEGPGELVHPYYGTRTLAVQEFRQRETTRKGGMATFSITLCEPGKNTQPTTSSDTSWAVSQASGSVTDAAVADFTDRFDASGPEWVRIDALSRINTALDAVEASLDKAAIPVNLVSQVGTEAASLRTDAASLLSTPSTLASRLSGVVSGLFPEELANPVPIAKALIGYDSQALESSPLSTMGARTGTNASAVSALVRCVALAEAAESVSAMDFDTYEDSVVVRDLLVDALDQESATASDAVYQTLSDLRVAVVKDFAECAALPRLTSYASANTLPAVVVSHAIYGDATRADEICTRNHVRHPGAVPGGVDLEVITDA